MRESKTAFEQFIKNSPNYNKLVFIHGERLFIFEDGQYKNLHVQLAWEVWQAQQKRIDAIEQEVRIFSQFIKRFNENTDKAIIVGTMDGFVEGLERALRGEHE